VQQKQQKQETIRATLVYILVETIELSGAEAIKE
jgi:hypothetical protein